MGCADMAQATRARSYRTPWLPEAGGTSSTGDTDIPLPKFPPHRSIYELRPTRGQKPSHIDPREADSRDVVLRSVYRADRQIERIVRDVP